MTVCPIAIVAGCRKCPASKLCPLKSVLGDTPPQAAPATPVRKPRKRAAGKQE